MAGTPTAERPPKGLDADHLGIWRHALKTLQAQGTWDWELAPLLAEYVYALMGARDARDGFKWLRYAENADDLPEIAWTTLGKIAGGLPAQWDRHAKRAAALADQLALTPRGRKAVGVGDSDEDTAKPDDAFVGLDSDELAPRRNRAQAA